MKKMGNKVPFSRTGVPLEFLTHEERVPKIALNFYTNCGNILQNVNATFKCRIMLTTLIAITDQYKNQRLITNEY